MAIFLGSLVYLWLIRSSNTKGTCTSETIPVVRMCMGGAAVGPSVLMNFYDADFQKFPQCKCSVEVKSGTFLSLNEVFAPEGLKCGTSITIKDDSEDIRHIINCNGETTVKYLQRGQVIKFILNRHFWDADANYCYRLNMGGGASPSIHVKCDYYTTSTSTTTPTTTETTTKQSTSSERGNITQALYTDQIHGKVSSCTNITVMVLASLLGVITIYSVSITVFIFRRNKGKVPDVHVPEERDEVYEEIKPTYNPGNGIITHNPSITTRPLPNPYHGHSYDDNNTVLRKAPIQPKWNNTYDRVEDNINGMIYVNQRF